MELHELKSRKQALETDLASKIQEAVTRFMEETGVGVLGVDVRMHNHQSMEEPTNTAVVGSVTIEINL
jgi:hypothetical protein